MINVLAYDSFGKNPVMNGSTNKSWMVDSVR